MTDELREETTRLTDALRSLGCWTSGLRSQCREHIKALQSELDRQHAENQRLRAELAEVEDERDRMEAVKNKYAARFLDASDSLQKARAELAERDASAFKPPEERAGSNHFPDAGNMGSEAARDE